jgi:Cof subfamily protein (haloacid dehalogenase superfamily)
MTSEAQAHSYRLLACDLDGTLVGHDTIVPEAVRRAIAAVQDRGIHVTLATGRGYSATLPFASVLNISEPIICYQGGLIQHPLTGELLFQATMTRSLVLNVLELAHALHWHVVLYFDDEIYIEEFRRDKSFYHDLLGLDIRRVDDLTRVLREHPSDPAKFLFVGEETETDHIQAELSERYGDHMQIVRSHTLFVEGNPLGVNKGDALRRLAEYLHVPQRQVMAIGDQGNDIAMLTWAGLGVAMGSGSATTQAAADWIAPPLSAGGAVTAMEHFLLEPERGKAA